MVPLPRSPEGELNKTRTVDPRTSVSGKVKTLAELAPILAAARRAGRRIAHCHGVFDLMHPGHIVHLREARRHGDLVVVTVTPDRFVHKGPGRPLFGEGLRLQTLAAVEYVDYVALNEWPTAVETIRLLKPHVYVKGEDYADASADVSGKIQEEERAVRSAGGRIAFTHGFASSSSRIINRTFSGYPDTTQRYLAGLRRRYDADRVIERLRGLADLRVLVVGEAILDQYCYCEPVGKSPKEAIVSTRFVSEESFAGGAAATANHLAGLCKGVTLLTAMGPDGSERRFFGSKLLGNVRMRPIITPDRPTVLKRRFVRPTFLSKMFELQYLVDSPIPPDTEKAFGAIIEEELGRHDMVVVNDFGHGLMTPRLRDLVSRQRKFLALNAQSNSANHGYNTVTNYRRADYVAIDDPELRLSVRDKYGRLPDLTARVRKALRARTLLVSLGALGSVVLSTDGWHEAPALAVRIVDRVGAGDALFAVTSPCAFRGFPTDLLCFVGNCVGALAVETVCNRDPVDPVTLFKFLQTLLK
jgi:rfaE bifunctional protein nucleotidyltransferase chain/domain